jgi:hypothetical protein
MTNEFHPDRITRPHLDRRTIASAGSGEMGGST